MCINILIKKKKTFFTYDDIIKLYKKDNKIFKMNNNLVRNKKKIISKKTKPGLKQKS